MELTSEQMLKYRSQALEASLKIESLYPNSPLIVDLNALPKSTNFNATDWMNLVKKDNIAIFDSSKGQVERLDNTQSVIDRAQQFYEWLTDTKSKIKANGATRDE